jgi:hypothetical protein
VSNLPSTFDILRKVLLLALLGLAAVVLVGPVVAILSVVFSLLLVVAPFAFIGFLVWLMIQVATGRQHLAWDHMRQFGRTVADNVQHVSRRAAYVLKAPARLGREIGIRAAHLAGGAWRVARASTRVVGEVLLIAAIGLLVGGGMDLFLGPPRHDPGLPIPWNACLGAALGCLAGIVMVVLERRRAHCLN